jgi:hypothetical protein
MIYGMGVFFLLGIFPSVYPFLSPAPCFTKKEVVFSGRKYLGKLSMMKEKNLLGGMIK